MNEMIEITLQSEIDKRVGELVSVAERLIKDLGDKIGKIEANQIQNMIAVANSAPHPAVVTNMVRYQMRRKGKPKEAWEDTGLGEALIGEIDGMIKTAADLVQDARCGDIDNVQLRLIRLLLGFMGRCYVYEQDRYEELEKLKKKA